MPPSFCIRHTRKASARPTARPKAIATPRDCVFLANQPISTPVISPLMVDPMTMPTIPALTSGSLGAEMSAERPSKIPSTPPSTRPRMGLLTWSLLLPVYYPSAAIPLGRPDQQQGADGEIGEHQRDRRAVDARQPAGALEAGLAVGGH